MAQASEVARARTDGDAPHYQGTTGVVSGASAESIPTNTPTGTEDTTSTVKLSGPTLALLRSLRERNRRTNDAIIRKALRQLDKQAAGKRAKTDAEWADSDEFD